MKSGFLVLVHQAHLRAKTNTEVPVLRESEIVERDSRLPAVGSNPKRLGRPVRRRRWYAVIAPLACRKRCKLPFRSEFSFRIRWMRPC